MPDGIIEWFDPDRDEGRVLHGGRRYACRGDEVDPACRSAGARVHFDVSTDRTTATGVVPRSTRASVRRSRAARPGRSVTTRRLVGAGSLDSASAADRELRPMVRPTPTHLARWWAAAFADGSLDELMVLYAPDAVVEIGGVREVGARHLRSALGTHPRFGDGREPDTVTGDDGAAVLCWRDPVTGESEESQLAFSHGEITGQRFGAPAEPPLAPEPGELDLQVVTRGPVTGAGVDRAVDKVRRAATATDRDVLFGRVKLTQLRDPAARRPSIAEVMLDVDGEVVRARSSADRVVDAIDRLEGRLADQLRHHKEHRSWVRPAAIRPEPGEWRHGNLPRETRPWFDRPRDERDVVRRHEWVDDELTVDEAICDLELLDDEFLVFRELVTGVDAMVCRDPDGSFVLRQTEPRPEAVAHTAEPVTLDEKHPPRLTERGAIELLDLSGERFLFFEDADTQRGAVAYRRLDGHYGLVVPPEATS